LQNVTISTPTGAFDVFGSGGTSTNYLTNVVYTVSKTNLAAINKPFAGFSNQPIEMVKWQGSWATQSTNKPFSLQPPD